MGMAQVSDLIDLQFAQAGQTRVEYIEADPLGDKYT